jgi:hypothetical protein
MEWIEKAKKLPELENSVLDRRRSSEYEDFCNKKNESDELTGWRDFESKNFNLRGLNLTPVNSRSHRFTITKPSSFKIIKKNHLKPNSIHKNPCSPKSSKLPIIKKISIPFRKTIKLENSLTPKQEISSVSHVKACKKINLFNPFTIKTIQTILDATPLDYKSLRRFSPLLKNS